MNSFLPPTITPVDDEEPNYSSNIIESAPIITPVEEEPQVEYVEEPQVEYVEQPQVEYVEEPQVEYVEEPKVEYVEETPTVTIPQQTVTVPVEVPQPQPQADLTQYYAILDQCGPVEPDDDFQLDGWKQFYPLDDPFFNWQKGYVAPNWRVYNPEDRMNLAVY